MSDMTHIHNHGGHFTQEIFSYRVINGKKYLSSSCISKSFVGPNAKRDVELLQCRLDDLGDLGSLVQTYHTVDCGHIYTVYIGCLTESVALSLAQILGVKVSTSRERSVCWITNDELPNKWFPVTNERISCMGFIDGYGGSGYSRSTCALKVADANFARSKVHTLIEWRGDEQICNTWLPFVDDIVSRINIDYLILDQKASIYVVGNRGSGSEECFIWSKNLTRSKWSNLEFHDPNELQFQLQSIYPDNNIRCIAKSSLVPPMFHCLAKVRQYAIGIFSEFHGMSEHEFFNLMDISIQPTTHGHPYQSGEARQAISWAPVKLKNYECVELFQLLHEIQQMVYCTYTRSEECELRLHVLTWQFAEVLRRMEKICQQREAKKKTERANRKRNRAAAAQARRNRARRNAAQVIPLNVDVNQEPAYVAPEPVPKKSRKFTSKLQHVYMANLVYALPAFYMRHDVALNCVLEEKLEQSFLINKVHFLETRGQPHLQLMHFLSDLNSKSRSHFVDHGFRFRSTHFSNICIRKDLINVEWLSWLMRNYGSMIHNVEDEHVIFKVAGANSVVISSDVNYDCIFIDH